MTDYIFNRAVVRDYLCAECHSGLIEVWADDDYHVVCSHDRAHAGRVRKSTVDMLAKRSVLEGIEVRMAYPELAPASDLALSIVMDELYGERSGSCPSKD